jgi:ubiquinone/menaquinone biosynthesis C-methylase UbiE
MTTAPAKTHKDIGMEGMVAKWYAANTGKSLDEFTTLARRIASRLPPGSAVLDIAAGPGYFSIELAKLGSYEVVGLDISRTFVEMARKKAAAENVHADFRQGSASRMPFANDTFDFLVCRAAFKNLGQPVRALQEMCRVLNPRGGGLIIDLRHDASPESIAQHVDGMRLTTVDRILTKLAFRLMLLKNAYTREQFQQMLAQTAFRGIDIREDDIGFEISITK